MFLFIQFLYICFKVLESLSTPDKHYSIMFLYGIYVFSFSRHNLYTKRAFLNVPIKSVYNHR